jgi:hypothetical protein
MLAECSICCEGAEEYFECGRCRTIVCGSCVIRTMETYHTRPQCLGEGCTVEISYRSLARILGESFLRDKGFDFIVEGLYREQMRLLEKTEKSLDKYQQNLRLSRAIHEINYRLISSPARLSPEEDDVLRDTLTKLRGEQMALSVVETSSRRKVFCPKEECGKSVLIKERQENGHVIGGCVACNTEVCMQCEEKFDPGHRCSKERLDTLEEIKRDSKPCPRCNIPISRTVGCDHMFCVSCHTSFNWKTMQLTRGGLNPHYFEVITNGVLPPEDPQVPQQEERNCVLLEINSFTEDPEALKEHRLLLTAFEKTPTWNPETEEISLNKIRGDFIMDRITEKEFRDFLRNLFRRKEYTIEISSLISTLFHVFCDLVRYSNLERWKEFKERSIEEMGVLARVFGYKAKTLN